MIETEFTRTFHVFRNSRPEMLIKYHILTSVSTKIIFFVCDMVPHFTPDNDMWDLSPIHAVHTHPLIHLFKSLSSLISN
jgi:hypothetical protein